MFDTIKRYLLLTAILLIAWFILIPGTEELHTLLIIVIVECLAIVMSAMAAYVFTKIDFTDDYALRNLGYIFLGVHLCVGLTVLGVYLVQFS